MTVYLGADHGGFKLKEKIKNYLQTKGITVEDLGTYSEESVDYPDFAFPVAEKVSKGKSLDSHGKLQDLGIIICTTGIGSCIAANKIKGARAALGYNEFSVERTRNDNNANVLCLGGGGMDHNLALKMVEIFMDTPFSFGERHQRRINKIKKKEDRKLKIIPAILTKDPKALERMLREAESFTDYVQIDIMDGEFVPTRSVTAGDLAKIKTPLQMEAHLMVEEPEKSLEGFRKAGCKKLVFHVEGTSKPQKVVGKARELKSEIGLAINPGTFLSSTLEGLLEKVDSALFLAVHPGAQNQKFIPEVLGKVKELRRRNPNIEIGLDGGIKLDNIEEAKEAGADFVCVGSAIFGQDNPKKAYEDFRKKDC